MSKKKVYTKRLGRKVAINAKPKNSHKYHVVSSESQKWAVVADGKIKASKVFLDQINAINYAKEIAGKIDGEVVIHKKTGEVEDLLCLTK